MKVFFVTLFALASASRFSAVVENNYDEVQLIKSRKTQPTPRQAAPTTSACNPQPLDAMMLIEKYGMNISDPIHLAALSDAVNGNLMLGSTTQFIQEANDASRTGALVVDGLSGDTNWPFGAFKPLLTVGEINHCQQNHGEVYVGVPDGMGAYLKDDDTLRIVVQSESYGPLLYESIPWPVNGNTASFTGSHIQYVDFDRKAMSEFMTHGGAASEMLKGFGQVATKSYNLRGEQVSDRATTGPTTFGAHFSNTDASGNYVVAEGAPKDADWLMQSLCASHLEEKHQFGPGMGVEDDIYITNEEWITYVEGSEFVGISAHVVDLANQDDYAIGSVTNTGFEKIVEINPMHTDYVVLAVSGYNGAYSGNSAELDARNAEYGMRPDGMPYVWTRDVVPARIYIGVKGLMEDGSPAPASDFLARNGMRYGKVYGYAIDMSASGPTDGMWRDAFHKPRNNGAKVPGKWVALDWQWDGIVRNYRHDGAWEFQHDPKGYEGTNWKWWNANGYDDSGSKTEHLTPDTTSGVSAFIQGSTAGYFGHYYLHDLGAVLDNARGDLPSELEGSYYVYQGENDISTQIQLGGAGMLKTGVDVCPGITDATQNCDNDNSVKNTFEDIDGLEVLNSADGLYVIIQEDSGNDLGERMFIAKLEHNDDGNELSYMFMAQSGGKFNTRMSTNVGIPAGANDGGNSHEFSGVIDLSGMLAMNVGGRLRNRGLQRHGKPKGGGDDDDSGRYGDDDDDSSHYGDDDDDSSYTMPSAGVGEFLIKAGDGFGKRMAESMVPINNKLVALGLQAHNMDTGAVAAFKADRGGQLLLYKPDL